MTDTAVQTAEVVHEEDFPHAPAVVWRGITDQALLSRWLMTADFAPEVGRAIRFSMEVPPNSPWDGIVKGEVLEVEPERRLVLTWVSGGLDSTVAYTLTPIDTGTRLKVVQSGFELPKHQHAYQGATYGWRANFGKLKGVLDEA